MTTSSTPRQNRTLRASVTADSATTEGADATILVDGADTPITAAGLEQYTPTPGDRLLVQKVGGRVEVMQFLSRGSVPYASSGDVATLTTQVNANTTAVATAQSTANSALTSANGKNVNHYSTSTPGTTANLAGDNWYQQDGTGTIIAHFIGQGGTTWQSVTLDSAVIDNLDAGKITAGTLSAIDIVAATYYSKTGVGPGVQGMTISNDNGGGVIKGYAGFAGETPSSINPGTFNSSPGLKLFSGSRANIGEVGTSITLESGPPGSQNISFTGSVADFNNMTITTTNQLNSTGGLVVSGGGGSTISGGLTLLTGDMHIGGTSASLYVPNAPTTTNAANARISTTNGQLLLSTSLSKFKLKQRELSADDVRGLLDVPVKSWFDLHEASDHGGTDGLRRIPGLVAEDVEEHAPLFALYDGDKLQGVAYDRIGPALIALVREQATYIKALQQRVTNLELAH